MTANEQADELELLLDRSSSYGSPGYEDFELSSALTEAQDYYIKKFIDELNNRKNYGFQEVEIRRQGLSALVKRSSGLTQSASQTGVYSIDYNIGKLKGTLYDLPTDVMYLLDEEVTVSTTTCDDQNPIIAEVIPVAFHELKRLYKNKYRKPFSKSYGDARVWRTEIERSNSGRVPADTKTVKRVQLITDGSFTVTNSTYKVTYLKNPLSIVVDRDTVANQRNCELDDSTHRIIVDIAKDLMLERVKEQKVQNIESVRDLE